MMNLGNLLSHREDILKAEIGALLFNLGKTHAGISNWRNYFSYVKQLFSSYKDYYKNGYFENELSEIDFNLKKFILNNKVTLPDNSGISWKEFFFGNSSGEDLIKKIFFRGCENINSGIDKGSPKKQLKTLWISNAFGSVKRDEIKEDDFDKSRLCFFQKFHRFLEDKSYYNSPDWVKIRNFVFKEINAWYSRLLSDSRFPVNDVTLWAQAYMTASMFKATLAGLYLDNSKDKTGKTRLEKFLENPQEIKWSILGIQYDKLGLAEKGLKAASIKWYRDTSEKVDDAIKNLIEIEYPLGNEVYRDETGIYFVVADNIKGKKEEDFYKIHDDLSDIKSKVQEIFTNEFDGEIYPAIFLTEPSRGLMNLGHLVEKARGNFLKAEIKNLPNVKLKSITFNNKDYYVHPSNNFLDESDEKKKEPNTAIGICPICKMRLIFKSDLKKRNSPPICETCHNRIHHARVRDWKPEKETIWLDELQDKNGRVALVTLKFEVDKWLNGDLLNSLVNQNINFPINANCRTINELLNDVVNTIKQNKKLNNTCLSNYHTNIPNIELKQLVEKWFLERSIGSKWEEFIKNNLSNSSAIDFDGRKIEWQKLNNNDIEFLANLILQFLLRKNPSPARLKRVWETTREFFVDMESSIVELAGIPKKRGKRLVWSNVDIEDGEYQDGDILFWAKNKTVYLISSIEVLKKNKFNLWKYNSNESKVITLDKNKATEQTYQPYFTILSPTPVSWQFIIPAEYVPDLIKNIQKEYYKNFKWVYGKLPLHIGVVVQNYKKPLYVGIKALRKIRRDKQKWQDLKMILCAKDFKARQKKAFHHQQVPEQIADCENYYSLFERADDVQKQYEFYLYPDENRIWIDITQNATDTDKFNFYPNTFDFEFLDTNARRNDIYYEKARRVMKYKQMRPYDIENWQYFEKFRNYFSDKKSSSKLQKLVSLIYSKLEDWKDDKESIKTFMLSSFINILELKNKGNKDEFSMTLGLNNWETLENLKESEFIKRLYMFLDMFEFWHTTLKEV